MYSIVITGTPVEGFKFYGPFLTEKAAREWIESHGVDLDCWVAELRTDAPTPTAPTGDAP